MCFPCRFDAFLGIAGIAAPKSGRGDSKGDSKSDEGSKAKSESKRDSSRDRDDRNDSRDSRDRDDRGRDKDDRNRDKDKDDRSRSSDADSGRSDSRDRGDDSRRRADDDRPSRSSDRDRSDSRSDSDRSSDSRQLDAKQPDARQVDVKPVDPPRNDPPQDPTPAPPPSPLPPAPTPPDPTEPVESVADTKLKAVILDPDSDSTEKVKLLFDESMTILHSVLGVKPTKEYINLGNLEQMMKAIKTAFRTFKKPIKTPKSYLIKSPCLLNLLKRVGKINAYIQKKDLPGRFAILKDAVEQISKDDMLDRRIMRLRGDLSSFDRSITKQVDLTNLLAETEKLSVLLAEKQYLWTYLYGDFEANTVMYLFDQKQGCEDLLKQEEESDS